MSTAKLVRFYLRWGHTSGTYDHSTSYFSFLTTMTSTEQDYYTARKTLVSDGNIYTDVLGRVLSDFPLDDIANVSKHIACNTSALKEDPVLTRLVNLMGDASIPWTYDFEDVSLSNQDTFFQVATDAEFTTIIQEGHYTSNTSGGKKPIYITQASGTGYRTDLFIPLYIYNETNDTIKTFLLQGYTFQNNATSRGLFCNTVSLTENDNLLRPLIALPPYVPPTPETDPYLPGGMDPSGTGGGTGTFSETGDTIGIPGLPSLSAVDTGFITLFNPSAAQVKALANYMWSASFDLTTFKNIVANPIDCILGLSIVPVNPPNAGSKAVTVGNIPTDVTLPYLSSQYVEVDCGTLNVQEFWGSYLDYSPYTKMSLYLPYIGIIPLDIDDVMNASIAIKYHVDVLSGACVAYVLCNGTQLYTYVGQCSSNVPITSNDFTNTVNGILGIAGSIGKLAADGGASAPTEAAGIAANAINALKPNIQKSGAMSGTGGLMGVQTPYLICQRPRQSVPASQNTFTGYPANITAKLSDLSGYTEVDSIHLDGLSATQEEQQEIMDLLTSGVII